MTLSNFERVGAVDEFEPGVLYDRLVGGQRVVVVRYGERFYAMRNACAHWGYFITPGKLLDDGSLLCPAHGAVFRLEDGEPLDGPADEPLTLYAVRVEAGEVMVAPLDGQERRGNSLA